MTLPFLEFNHVCILVKDVEKAAKAWMKFLRVTEEDCYDFEFDVTEEDAKLRTINIPAGNGVWIQLVQPMDEKGGMASFLAKRGEGVQHICFTCPDSMMEEHDQRVREAGQFKLLFPEPREDKEMGMGRYQMTHPRTSNGVIIETLSKGWDRDWRALKAAKKK